MTQYFNAAGARENFESTIQSSFPFANMSFSSKVMVRILNARDDPEFGGGISHFADLLRAHLRTRYGRLSGYAGWKFYQTDPDTVPPAHRLELEPMEGEPDVAWVRMANDDDDVTDFVSNWVHADQLVPNDDLPLGGVPCSIEESGLVVVRESNLNASLTGRGADIITLRPNDELLATIPERVHPYAEKRVYRKRGAYWETDDDGANPKLHLTTANVHVGSGQELLDLARTMYRNRVIERYRSRAEDAEVVEARLKRQRQAEAQSRYIAFASRRRPDADKQLIGTLPFVPHGLASSRRWGIEVESGGARGVSAPEGGWGRKRDGSLRSAYAGYIEVQDFEPYDEEETTNTPWGRCENATLHVPFEEYYNVDRDEHMYRPLPGFIDPTECDLCGPQTRMVRREPQTIHHSEQAGDCAEFVSPILVSMHSKGLKEITEQLSVQPQNDSAGVHVHVEANDLTDEQIATLVYGYDVLEGFLEPSYRRNRRDYCRRSDADEVINLARRIKDKSIDRGPIAGRDRYRTVNTQSLRVHGTIEFRAMGPVYEYDYLVRWAMFCREMVNTVAAGATLKEFAKVRSWNDVLGLFAKYGKEYLRAAVYEMTGEVGEAARLEKASQPVTTEALDADFGSVTLNWGALAGTFEQATARLVGAMNDIALAV